MRFPHAMVMGIVYSLISQAAPSVFTRGKSTLSLRTSPLVSRASMLRRYPGRQSEGHRRSRSSSIPPEITKPSWRRLRFRRSLQVRTKEARIESAMESNLTASESTNEISNESADGTSSEVSDVSTTPSNRRANIGLGALALARFKANPWAYIPIPIIAGLVGYITNWLAVQMIFYPIQWKGIPLRVWPDEPFGLFGWQGIVPAKTGKMSERMVEMVTTRLLSVPEVFSRLSPQKVSENLMSLVQNAALPSGFGLHWLSAPFLGSCLRSATRDLQQHIESILSIRDLVVGEMLRDRTILVELFQKVGAQELRFLTDSGLFFGFLLGLIQMTAWLLFPRPWTLPLGGAIVGYLTNWIALKMIFEPVNPVKIFGIFELQGMFLRRQEEVSVAFSEHLSKAVLTSQKMWGEMLGGSGASELFDLLRRNVPWFLPTAMVQSVFNSLRNVLPNLPDHSLHQYADGVLSVKDTLISKMRAMTPAEFEGVLHPIFQEDEFTLILAGAFLGAIAGAVQQQIGSAVSKKKIIEDDSPSEPSPASQGT